MSAPYPWLAPAWRRLQEARSRGQLAHALLLRGRAGFGKRQFAEDLIKSLLCSSPREDFGACGACRDCSLLAAATHPDLLRVVPAEPGKGILVDAVRELGHFFTLRSHYGAAKVALIEPADAMNRAAANALLKLLEEPPAGACLILVADRAERLPATIRSRCQHHVLDRVNDTSLLAGLIDGGATGVTAEVLARAGGSPLRTAELAEPAVARVIDSLPEMLGAVADGTLSPVAAAAQIGKFDLVLLIDQIQRLCHELLLLQYSLALPLEAAGRKPAAGIQRLANRLDSRKVAAFLEKLIEVKQLKLSSSNLRDQDLGESLWFDWRSSSGNDGLPSAAPRH